ncbi:MAG: AraC family transcriptional regulator [Pseudomonadota bacterium]
MLQDGEPKAARPRVPDGPIHPAHLTDFVPGRILCTSEDQQWDDLFVRGYRYAPLEVAVPRITDGMIVIYRGGRTTMARTVSGPTRQETVGPGDISLLTYDTDSHWHWGAPIDVLHLYLPPSLLQSVAEETLELDGGRVALTDCLKTHDPLIEQVGLALETELSEGCPMGRVYADSLAQTLALHLLKTYCVVTPACDLARGGLEPRRLRAAKDFIAAHLDRNIALRDLADAAGLSPYHFARSFKTAMGVAPHGYVLEMRLKRAYELAAKTGDPLSEIAAATGFSDQSHLTRRFKAKFGLTPGQVRGKLQ